MLPNPPLWLVLAGPAANFLLAILIFAAIFMTLGGPGTNVIGKVLSNSAASSAGLESGDKILSVAGRETANFTVIQSVVIAHPGETVQLRFERGRRVREVAVHFASDDATDALGHKFKRGLLGVSPARLPIYRAIPDATRYTWVITLSIVDGIIEMIRGRVSTKEIGGPIRIAQIAGQGASLGALPFVQLLALLSINLGFINLLPVPMLDGGHLFFYAVEGIRRRPISARALEWAFRGGLAVILALVLFTTVNDLGSLGLWDRLQRLIG
jgi:regulator of sigma E protease